MKFLVHYVSTKPPGVNPVSTVRYVQAKNVEHALDIAPHLDGFEVYSAREARK